MALGIGLVGIFIYLVIILLTLLVGVGGTILWIWMLVECLTKESSEGNDKIIWAIVILCTHALGGLLYFFVRRPERIQTLGQ